MASPDSDSEPADLVTGRGGRLPHGTILSGSYGGHEFEAVVRDGAVVFEGERYSSLSAAALAAIQSTGADRKASNGWRFWKRQDPKDGEWKTCAEVRGGVVSRRGSEGS